MLDDDDDDDDSSGRVNKSFNAFAFPARKKDGAALFEVFVFLLFWGMLVFLCWHINIFRAINFSFYHSRKDAYSTTQT